MKVIYKQKCLYIDWEISSEVLEYKIELLSEAGKVEYSTMIEADPDKLPVIITPADYPCIEGQAYRCKLYEFREKEESTIIIPSSLQILERIKEELEKRTTKDGSITIQGDILLGQEEESFSLDQLKELTGNPFFEMEQTSEPILDEIDELLTLKGDSKVFGRKSSVLLTFSVSDAGIVLLDIQFDLPEHWVYSDTFQDINKSVFDLLDTGRHTLYIQCSEREVILENNTPVTLKKGLNLIGKMFLPRTLNGEHTTYKGVLYGGSIELLKGRPIFELKNLEDIPELRLLNEQRAELYEFTDSSMCLSNTVTDSENEETYNFESKAILRGYAGDAEERSVFEMNLPQRIARDTYIQKLTGKPYMNPFADYINRLYPVSVKEIFFDDWLSFGMVYRPLEPRRIRYDLKAALPENSSSGIDLFDVVKLESVSLLFSIDYYPKADDETWQYFQAILTGKFTFNEQFRFGLEVRIPDNKEWTLRLEPDFKDGLLNALASFIGINTGLLDALPSFFGQLLSFTVEDIQVKGNPFDRLLTGFGMKLKSTEEWNIIPSVLALKEWSLSLQLSKQMDTWRTEAFVYGKIDIGIEVGVLVHIGSNHLITIQLDEKGIHIPSLGTIFEALNLDGWMGALPKGFGELGDITINRLIISINNKDKPFIESVSFSMGTTESWNIIPDMGMTIDQIRANFVYRPKAENPIKGRIQATTSVSDTKISVELSNMEADSKWRLLTGILMLHIPGLRDMSQWLMPSISLDFIPEAFMPFPDGLDLAKFDLALNITEQKIERVYLRIQNRGVWDIISGWLSVNHVVVTAELDSPLADNADNKFNIQSIIDVGGMEIYLNAMRNSLAEHWIFEGKTEKTHVIDFNNLAQELDLIPFTLPDAFPKKISIISAETKIIPAEEYFKFAIDTEFDWTFHVGPINIDIRKLFFMLETKQLQDQIRPYQLEVSGAFAFGNIVTDLKYITGNQPESETIFTAEFSREQLKDLKISDITDTMSENGESGWDTLDLPESLSVPAFKYLNLYINTTKDHYAVWGEISGLGTMAVIAKKVKTVVEEVEQEKWAYFAAASLDKEFKFSNIIEELSVIDDILCIESAGLVISSFDQDTLYHSISTVGPCSEILPLPEQQKKIVMYPGALVYGVLKFKGTIFKNIIKLGNQEEGLSTFFLAQIAKDPIHTRFEAAMNSFELFRLLTFSDIKLVYTPSNSQQFDLNGKIALALGEHTYYFKGSMKVYEEYADYDIKTAQQIINPLGVKGLTIEELGLNFHYTFSDSNTQNNEGLDLYLGGKVGFGKKDDQSGYPLVLEGRLYLKELKFKVFEVKLSEPLSIYDFLESIFDNLPWSKNSLDITFNTGQLYYAQEKIQLKDFHYQPGFHLDTAISIYDHEFLIQADITETVSIRGSAAKPLEFAFISLTDAAGTGKGPGIVIDIETDKKRVGITGGLSLFNEKFLSVPEIVYDFKADEFLGTVAYAGDIDILRGPISFVWNKKDGLQIKEWPLAWITDALDYAELLKEASEIYGNQCGKLVGLVFEKAITTEFKITPEFDELTDSKIKLNVTYEVSAVGKSLIKSALSPIYVKLTVPEEISFEKLAGAIKDTIVENAYKIAWQIISQPGKLVEFITVVGLTAMAKETLSTLFCHGYKAVPPADAAITETSQAAGEAGSAADAGRIGAAMGAMAQATALVKMAEGLLEALISFLTLLLGLAAFFGFETDEVKEARKRKEEQERKKELLDQKLLEAKRKIEEMLTLDSCNAGFDKVNRIAVLDWKDLKKDAGDAEVTYRVVGHCDNSIFAFLDSEPEANSISFSYNREIKEKIVIQITVKAKYQKDGNTYEAQGNSYVMTLLRPQLPTNITAIQKKSCIVVAWDKLESQTAVMIAFYKNQQLIHESAGITEQPYEVPYYDIENGAECMIKTYVVDLKTGIQSSESLTSFIYSHKMAFGTKVRYEAEKFYSESNIIHGAENYKVALYNTQRELIKELVTESPVISWDMVEQCDDFHSGETYIYTIEASCPGYLSRWYDEQTFVIPDSEERLHQLLDRLTGERKSSDEIIRIVYKSFEKMSLSEIALYIYQYGGILNDPAFDVMHGFKEAGILLMDTVMTVKTMLPDIELEIMAANIMAVYGGLSDEILRYTYELKGKNYSYQEAFIEMKEKYSDISTSKLTEVLMKVY